MPSIWLWGGFRVALGGFSRLFEVRSSRLKVRGSVLTLNRSPQRLEVGEGLLVGKLIPGQLFICSRHIAGLQSKLLKHNVSRHGNAHRLVEREVTVEALPAKTAISREHQLVGGDVFQAAADARGNDIREIGLQRPVADDPDGNLLL